VSAGEAARWDAQSESYDSSYDDPRRGRLVRARLATALDLLGEGPGRVLDAGMGGGRLVEELAGRGWTVSGADVSDEMVALARRRAPELAGSLVVAPIETLPFEAASFDAVTALGVLEFTPDPEAALRELSRVLVPGGKAVVSWPSFRGLYTAWRGGVLYRVARALGRPAPPPARNPLEPERFEELLRAAGLEPEVTSMLGPQGRAARSARRAAQLVFSARKR
jgi:SAM-dependent methyltransferase